LISRDCLICLDKGLTELDKIIIVRSGEVELGIRADVILGMKSIPAGRHSGYAAAYRYP